MTEHALANRLSAALARLRAKNLPLWYVKIHGGGGYQRGSLPDYLITVIGTGNAGPTLIAMELKSPKEKAVPTLAQKNELRKMTRGGWEAHCVNNLDVAVEIVGNALEGRRFPLGVLHSNGREIPWTTS